MATIWKYEISPDENAIEMPRGARALTAQMVNGKACLYCLVEPEAVRVARKVVVVGTGWPFDPGDLAYVGTFQVLDTTWPVPLVFHVFIDREDDGE